MPLSSVWHLLVGNDFNNFQSLKKYLSSICQCVRFKMRYPDALFGFFLPLMHELDTNVFVKNKCIRGKNIQFFLSDNLLFQLSFPRRRESHVKAYGLLWDSRLRGNDMVRQFEIHPAKPPARIF